MNFVKLKETFRIVQDQKSKQMRIHLSALSHHLSIAILSIVNLCPTLLNYVIIGALATKLLLFS